MFVGPIRCKNLADTTQTENKTVANDTFVNVYLIPTELSKIAGVWLAGARVVFFSCCHPRLLS